MMTMEMETEFVNIELGKLRVPKKLYDWVVQWCKLTNTNMEGFWRGALYYSINELCVTLQENPSEALRLLLKKKKLKLGVV